MSAALSGSTWKVVRFGDVVSCVKRTTKNPGADGFDRVVGLDHMDSESLPLRRWDLLEALPDGTSFNRVFESGQVLFAKRRAYQRKVSVPDFDGICSGDILVLQVSGSAMLQQFLPYVIQSSGFFEHALGTSAGSLSPRTKWQELAKYEFSLPPIDEQQRIVETLRASDEAVGSFAACTDALTNLINSFVSSAYAAAISTSQDIRPTVEFGELTMGRQKAPKYELGVNPTRYLRVANVGHLEVHAEELETMDFSEPEIERFGMRAGDVILTEGDIVSPLNVGRAAVFDGGASPVCFQNTLIRVRPHSDVEPHFLLAMVEGARLAGVLAAAANTTTVTHLGLRRFAEVRLPYMPIEAQAQTARGLRALMDLRSNLRRHESCARLLATRLRERTMAS